MEEKINKNNEEYYLKNCLDCNIEMKCATLAKKYCFDCAKKRRYRYNYKKVSKNE